MCHLSGWCAAQLSNCDVCTTSDLPLRCAALCLQWADDQFWLPRLLEGSNVEGVFTFSDKDTIVGHELRVLPASEAA